MEIIQGASVKFAGAPPVNGFIIFSPIHRTVKMFITHFSVYLLYELRLLFISLFPGHVNKKKADHEEEGRRILHVMEEASEDIEESEENAEVTISGGEPLENSEN